MKPVIGITSAIVYNAAPSNNRNTDNVSCEFKEAVIKCGGFPVILPCPENTERADELAAQAVGIIRGLLVTGGPDIDPTLYGEEPVRAIGRTIYKRDIYETALIRAAVNAGKAVFGVCRGLEIINVAFGGTLYQDIFSQHPDCFVKHQQEAPENFPTHNIVILPGTRLASLFGETHYVNSLHHQAVKDIAPGFRVAARAKDGVIEAFESEKQNISAVQWHPEIMWRDYPAQLGLFADFVSRCV